MNYYVVVPCTVDDKLNSIKERLGYFGMWCHHFKLKIHASMCQQLETTFSHLELSNEQRTLYTTDLFLSTKVRILEIRTGLTREQMHEFVFTGNKKNPHSLTSLFNPYSIAFKHPQFMLMDETEFKAWSTLE